jgi:hypothetical protein
MVYVAVYLSASPREVMVHHQLTTETAAFLDAVQRGEWPYDAGDDPSFYCARHFRAPLSWGICRRNLRNALEPSDTVAFIAHRKHPGGLVDYRWAGFATVARKIRQTDIWEDQDHAIFRQYLNLLIQPNAGGGYVHREAHPGESHADWLWRLTSSKGNSSKGNKWKAKDFAAYDDTRCMKGFVPGQDRAANGELIEISPNYVIFSTDERETVLLADPPIVAEYRLDWGPQLPERWSETPLAQGLRGMTLGLTAVGRTLRLTTADPKRTSMQPRHPHIKISSSATGSAARWREDTSELLRDAGLS